MPGHHDHGVGIGHLVDRRQEAVHAGHPAVGHERRGEPEGPQHGQTLVGHRQIGGPRRHDHDPPGALRELGANTPWPAVPSP